MPTLIDIQTATKVHADARAILVERAQYLNDEIESLKRRLLPGIKNAVAAAKETRAALDAMIASAPELFVKPRTTIFHGIKVGFQKCRGKLSWASADAVIKLIKKHFPEQKDILIKTTEKPAKKALEGLSAGDLKKLGIEVGESGDQVVIAPVESGVDKIVNALLGEEESDEE